jgi:hypothetical protein
MGATPMPLCMQPDEIDQRGLLSALASDGRPLLSLTGLALICSGAFALFLSATRHFLPHDVQFLGMQPDDLCALHACRIVHFMFHDRVSFGGVIMAIGVLYVWLAEFPLKRGEAWAWWLFVLSGLVGFGSFLAYLGYGYLDTWHGAATLILLPLFVAGLAMSRKLLDHCRGFRSLTVSGASVPWLSSAGLGRAALLATGVGLVGGGMTITAVGVSVVFVPQDLVFMGLDADELTAINPRLIPLIAHDRAGFGGGVLTVGVMLLAIAWCARPSRSLWQALCAAGLIGFGCAIGVHPAIGYTDFIHLLPAYLGAALLLSGLVLTYGWMHGRVAESAPPAERSQPAAVTLS